MSHIDVVTMFHHYVIKLSGIKVFIKDSLITGNVINRASGTVR